MTSRQRAASSQWHPTRAASIAVVLLAAVLRLPGLTQVPPGFQFDEAHNAIDAAAIVSGRLALFFPANGGREPLLTYLHAPMLAALGSEHTIFALRLTSAFVGILTVAIVVAAFSRVLGRHVGVISAAVLAVTYWHLHFSRYSIRAILAPLFTTLTLLAWWRAVETRTRLASKAWWAAACGLAMAAAVYSHPSGRLLPVVVVAHGVWLAWHGEPPRRVLSALLIAGGTAMGAFVPLGLYFLRHPWAFTGHPSDVSIFAVASEQFDGNLAIALLDHAARIAGMLFISGDPSTFHNLPELPVFDPLTALLAVLGIGVLFGALFRADPAPGDAATTPAGSAPGIAKRRDTRASAQVRTAPASEAARTSTRRGVSAAAPLLVVWLIVMLLPTLLSDRPPNYSRAIATLPVLAVLPALGLTWLAGRVQSSGRATTQARAAPRPSLLAVLATLAVGVGGVWTAWHYFVAFPRLDHVYYSYDEEKLDALAELRRRSESNVMFLAPLWADHATIDYLNSDDVVNRLDAQHTAVIPAGARHERKAVTYAFPAEQSDAADNLAELLGAAAERETLLDRHSAPLLHLLTVEPDAWGDLAPPGNAPLEPRLWVAARYQAIGLAGYQASTRGDGAILDLRLWWEALGDIDRDYTTFVQLVDGDGQPAGQLDREPGGASYGTAMWSPGDIVVERFQVPVASGAAQPLSVRVGWYDQSTGERLALDGLPMPGAEATLEDKTALLLGPLAPDR